MSHSHHSFDRLRELEQRRYMRSNGAAHPRQDHARRYPANTLGPNDELIARRRGQRRNHVSITGAAPQNRNILKENIAILVFLAVSIWGLYSLIIYLLSHH
ncbi:MAG: hypothetical protein IKW48_07235 [Akkermansia sp.]|nr:hypothetical protein [Akkermansia sp.]